jgi:DNA-binding beta-propeller fold protein YncE
VFDWLAEASFSISMRARTIGILCTAAALGACFGAVTPKHAAAQPARSDACNDAAPAPITMLAMPGTPFQALPSADGCWVFVSMPAAGSGRPSLLALLRRRGGALAFEHVLQLSAGPTGMALTHDGHLLIVAAGPRIAFVDVDRLIDGRSDSVLGYLDDPANRRMGHIYASVTSDDKFAFVADENGMTVTVLDLARARSSHFRPSSIVGRIPTGALPIAVTLSADEKYMYLTSQWAPPSLGWPIECKREGANVTDTMPANPQGAIHIVDVARAKTDPEHSIIGSVPAGCSAVRLVLSPAGDRVYVTARNSNALLAFDTDKLRTDPSHALVGRVPVGTAPVGVAVVDSGRKAIVTNSNRFAGSRDEHQVLTVVDATKMGDGAAAVLGTIPAGAFPREMRVTADDRTLFLTNFGSQTVEMIDLGRLPIDTFKR